MYYYQTSRFFIGQGIINMLTPETCHLSIIIENELTCCYPESASKYALFLSCLDDNIHL